MKRMTRVIGAVAASSMIPFIGGRALADSDQTVRYEIRPIERQDRVDLEIALTFPADADGSSELALPRDWFGTPRMYESVSAIKALGSATLEATDEPWRRILTYDSTDRAGVRYVLSWDPAKSKGLAFSPSVDSEHFHFLGSQWMVRHSDGEQSYPISIQFIGLPDDWSVISSFGFGSGPHQITSSYDDLTQTFIAGGRYRTDQFEVRGKPVAIAVYGDFDLPDAEIFDAVRRVVTLERERMQDFDQPFYAVCLTERPRIRAGTSFLNAFVCLMTSDATREQLMLLLAHEMFHFWFPNAGEVVGTDRSQSSLRYEWLHEGFTEYFARLILVESGLVSEDWLVEQFNDDLENLRINPSRDITYQELRRREDEGEFTNIEKKLSYYRGAILALNWDTRIQRMSNGSTTLFDVIREIVEKAAQSGGRMTEGEFNALMARHGVDAARALQRHVINGKPIRPDPEAFAPRYRLEERLIPSFEPGFDLIASWKAHEVVGVTRGGPAATAGLRDGMKIAAMRNAWRFSSSWRADEPLTVIVHGQDGQREIAYWPKGPEVSVWAYVRDGEKSN
jgi:predicted metalloprotease with PDZ domain